MKLFLKNILSRYGSVDALNQNFQDISEAIDNTLSRDGSGPNEMLAPLDMNQKDILNASKVYTGGLVINGFEVEVTDTLTTGVAFQRHSFTAFEGQAVYSIAPFLGFTSSLEVFVDGLVLPPSAISISGSDVTIPAQPVGTEVVIKRYIREPAPITPQLEVLEDRVFALEHLNAGTAEPVMKNPGTLWYDTSSSIIKIRNSANTAWIDWLNLGATLGMTLSSSLTATGNVIVNAGASQGFVVSGPAGGDRNVYWRTSGVNRWSIIANNTTETGSNTGSNLNVLRYNDVGTSLGAALAITRSSGNVGVGTTAPLSKFHVAYTEDENGAIIENTTRGGRFRILSTGVTGEGLNFQRWDIGSSSFVNTLATRWDYTAIFAGTVSSTSEVMRVNATGVGIGTVNPTAGLSIARGIGVGALSLQCTTTPVSAGQRLFTFGFGSELDRLKARVSAFTENAWTTGVSTPAALTFNTTPSGSVTDAERMRLSGDGNLSIGSTSSGGFRLASLGLANSFLCGQNDGTNNPQLQVIHGTTGTALSATSTIGGAYSSMSFRIGAGAEVMRLDNTVSGGALLVKTNTSRSYGAFGPMDVQIEKAGSASLGIAANRNDTGAPVIVLAKSRGTVTGANTIVAASDTLGTISWLGADGAALVSAAQILAKVDGTPSAGAMPTRLEMYTTPAASSTPLLRLGINATGAVYPGVDNTQILGSASARWSVVYAGTGTINTSDAREKTDVRVFTSNEMAASKQLVKEIGFYKFLDSVALKGDAARDHCGLTVQRAIEVMESYGLDAFKYGFICHDVWEDGDRYSFRYDQLNLFLLQGINARLEALEA